MIFALRGARVHLGGRLVGNHAVVVEHGRISCIIREDELPAALDVRELDGGVLAAGFLDTQVNGGGGIMFNEHPTVDSLFKIGEAHRRYGTTGFLATVISDEIGVLKRAIRAVEKAIEEGLPGLLGIHMEGPMLAPSRNGIHDRRFMRGAVRELIELASALRCGRTLVTLAPEVVGPEAIAELVEGGVIVAAGHTEATYEEMREGFAAGITGVTHLFNAMSPITNRAPGAVGAALENQQAWCGLIVDGVHVHPATLRIALRTRPHDRFMLVTDAMPPVGTDLDSFDLQGRRIRVAGNRCVDERGILAGSNLTMEGSVRNLIDMIGLPTTTALTMASASPAEFLGMGDIRGRIAPRQAADLVWLDDAMKVQSTWIAGRAFEEARA